MAELQFPNLLGSFNSGVQTGRDNLAYDKQQNFNQLAGQAATAAPDDQSALVNQAIQTNPTQGLALKQSLQDFQDQHAKKVAGAANYVLSAYKSGNPAQVEGAYQAVKPFLDQIGAATGQTAADHFTPEMLPHLYQIVGQAAGTTPNDTHVVGPGGSIADNTGNVLYHNDYGQQYQNVPTGDGKVAGSFDRNTGNLRPAVPLNGGQAASGDPMTPFIQQANMAVQNGADPDKVQQWLIQKAAENKLQPEAPGVADSSQPSQAPTTPSGAQFGVGAKPQNNVRQLSAEDVAKAGLPVGTVAQQDSHGRISVVDKPSAAKAAADVGPGLSDDAITNAAWDKILTGKSITGFSKSAIDQRTGVSNMVATIAKQAGVSPQELSTTQGRNKALQSSMTNLQKQGDVQAKNEETFLNNADVLLNLSDSVGRSGIPAFNHLILNAKTNIGADKQAAQFATARNIVAQEYSKIASGATGAAGATQGAQEHALELINTSQTPEQLRGVIETLHQDIEGQKKATQDQLGSIQSRMQQFGNTGKAPASGSFPPAAIDHLRQHPELAQAFDAKYGQGASAKALGQ